MSRIREPESPALEPPSSGSAVVVQGRERLPGVHAESDAQGKGSFGESMMATKEQEQTSPPFEASQKAGAQLGRHALGAVMYQA